MLSQLKKRFGEQITFKTDEIELNSKIDDKELDRIILPYLENVGLKDVPFVIADKSTDEPRTISHLGGKHSDYVHQGFHLTLLFKDVIEIAIVGWIKNFNEVTMICEAMPLNYPNAEK